MGVEEGKGECGFYLRSEAFSGNENSSCTLGHKLTKTKSQSSPPFEKSTKPWVPFSISSSSSRGWEGRGEGKGGRNVQRGQSCDEHHKRQGEKNT